MLYIADAVSGQHEDADHIQHASKVVPVQHLATGAAADEQNPTPYLVRAHAIGDRQSRIISMDDLEACCERYSEHNGVWTAESQGRNVGKTKDSPFQP